MDIAFGNAHEAETEGTGWFIGFSDWTSGLLHVPKDHPLTCLCLKWFAHPSGDVSGDMKPVSEGRTVSMLVSEGVFWIEFSPSPTFAPDTVRRVTLRRHGDYAAWGAGIYHRWHCEAGTTVLTVRWNPMENAG